LNYLNDPRIVANRKNQIESIIEKVIKDNDLSKKLGTVSLFMFVGKIPPYMKQVPGPEDLLQYTMAAAIAGKFVEKPKIMIYDEASEIGGLINKDPKELENYKNTLIWLVYKLGLFELEIIPMRINTEKFQKSLEECRNGDPLVEHARKADRMCGFEIEKVDAYMEICAILKSKVPPESGLYISATRGDTNKREERIVLGSLGTTLPPRGVIQIFQYKNKPYIAIVRPNETIGTEIIINSEKPLQNIYISTDILSKGHLEDIVKEAIVNTLLLDKRETNIGVVYQIYRNG